MFKNDQMDNLFELIEKSHGEAAAYAHRGFSMRKQHTEALKTAGRDVMLLFPPQAGSCAMMSAVLSVRAKSLADAPCFVVAGAFHIDGTPVFGIDAEKTAWSAAFTGTNLSWDGHCWVVCGDLIADVSLLRTANSPESPATLSRKVKATFGARTGMIAFTASQARNIGMEYRAHHVLTEQEIDGLFVGSQALIWADR